MTREYPDRPIVGVGAVVLTERDASVQGFPAEAPVSGVVLVRRRFEPLAGQWSLPGGAVRIGETLAGAAAREVLEETGLVVEVGPVVEVLDRIMFDPDRRVRYHFVLVEYLCRPAGGCLRAGSDAADVAVADTTGLSPFGLTGEAEAIVRRALHMVRNAGDLR